MASKLRAAAVQMNSTGDVAANMEAADRLVREAAADDAAVVLLPEKFNLLAGTSEYFTGAEALDGPTGTWAADLARELGIDLIAGSFVERRPGREKLANTCVHFAPDGSRKAVYRKIHMFDVVVDGREYRESDHEEPGGEIVETRLADGTQVGLTVCYDLRFPELYRILAVRGARILTVPAAFTHATGEAHWELLLRARAVENQCFVIAANQFGLHGDGRPSFGNSMIVDPWGDVLARTGDDAEAVVVAELDFARQDEVRDKLPSLANRMPEAYHW